MSLSQSTLVLLHIVFRHGHRTPDSPAYPKNPHKNFQFKPYGRGQLTNEGKRECYKLGQYIRNYYNEYINKAYFPGILNATYTSYDRTKVSLQLFLSGLFCPKPISAHCISTGDVNDYFFNTSDFCKEFLPAYNNFHDRMKLAQNYRDVYKYIERYSGRKIKTIFDIYEIYFDMATEKECGLELPTWALAIYPEPITHLATWHYNITCGTPLLRSYSIKIALQEIIARSLRKIKKLTNVKIYTYSCHELNVAQFLIGLGSFTSPHIPNYCSCLVLEIHRLNNELFVKGLYKPNVLSELNPIHMWGENPCPLGRFINLVNSNFK